MSLTSCVVIPARLHSTRLPRKLLLSETGKPLLQHTYEAACRARLPEEVIIAADHEELAAVARDFGARVIMTSPTCPSGTDRLAEVAPQLSYADLIVNVQGDEPELSGDTIDQAIELLLKNPKSPMATLCTPIRERSKLLDPACVKVVWVADAVRAQAEYEQKVREFNEYCKDKLVIMDEVEPPDPASARMGKALYFSRAPIPHAREWSDELLTAEPAKFYQHLGLYVYRRKFLPQYAAMPRTPLEILENLEQLRVLENGYPIMIGVVDEPSIGIDTPADYAEFVTRFQARQAAQR